MIEMATHLAPRVGIAQEVHHARPQGARRLPKLLSLAANGERAFPSETKVKRGVQVVHGGKVLEEKLGRNDLCPCGSGRRFQEVLHEGRHL